MTKQQRILIICILASFIAFLDGSVVNVALPAITKELHGGLVVQQWVIDAYGLALGSLMLAAGSFSDLFGRKRIMQAGLIGFGIASIGCALAPTSLILITARSLQGAAGALLVPSSLALIIATFAGNDQGKAIGRWTAWTGIAFVVGPLLGGLLVQLYSWRLIFAINILPITVTVWLLNRTAEPQNPTGGKIDWLGLFLGILALSGLVYGLIEQAHLGWSSPVILTAFVVGLIALVFFLRHEARSPSPLLPLALFQNRNFSAGNLATLCIYAGLALMAFIVPVFLQQTLKYSAVMAGAASLPITLLMFALSSRFGIMSATYGPRLFMTAGPLISALGILTMLRVHPPVNYWIQFFPGIILQGIGLSITVAPLTSAILGSIDKRRAGIASATNNAVARIAGLIAISCIGFITAGSVNFAGFHRCLIVLLCLLLLGGGISFIGIRNILPAESRE